MPPSYFFLKIRYCKQHAAHADDSYIFIKKINRTPSFFLYPRYLVQSCSCLFAVTRWVSQVECHRLHVPNNNFDDVLNSGCWLTFVAIICLCIVLFSSGLLKIVLVWWPCHSTYPTSWVIWSWCCKKVWAETWCWDLGYTQYCSQAEGGESCCYVLQATQSHKFDTDNIALYHLC